MGISLIITMLTLMTPSDYLKLEKPWNRAYLIEKFGIYVYQLNDAIRSTEPKIISLLSYDNANKIYNVKEIDVTYLDTSDTVN